jgi:putative holliday junction resolvase
VTSDSSSSVSPGRLAGIDYGTVRIGIAVTDADQKFASPLENYTRRGAVADTKFFEQLAREERIVTFVVGLPVHLDGHESQKSTEARKFGQWLQQLTNVPVVFFDERFTSAEAEQLLESAEFTKKQRKARLDKLAAQILLSAYLEAGKPAIFKPQGLS